MRTFFGLACLTASAWGFQGAAVIREQTHQSVVMGGPRVYRLFLPPAYPTSQKRYPVIYWFHGYEAPNEQRDLILSAFVASHDVVLVDSGPVETKGNFPLYFPELVEQIDRTLRTVPDRGHRAVTGFGTGGFLALWEAAKSPDLVASASSLVAEKEADTGPDAFPVSTSLEDLLPGLEGIRTWIIGANPDITAVLTFHMRTFGAPLPKPELFAHADPYPNFGIWDWQVASERRSPGFTVLENVSRSGFRSAVREWLPSGAPVAGVKVSVTSPRLYTPGATYPVTYIRLPAGKPLHVSQRADGQGRLSFDVGGEECEVGVGAGPVLALAGYALTEDAWATVGKPVKLKLTFLNKGGGRSLPEMVRWQSPAPEVHFETATGRIFGLAPGESAATAMTFTYSGPARSGVRIFAVTGTTRMALDVPLFPPAAAAEDFEIADGRQVDGYPRALGSGNHDGHASPGETVAILLKEAGTTRAAEVFTNDACIDNTIRVSEGGTRYSLPMVRASCQPGHRVHLLARVGPRYAAIDFPVWYR